jgi:hypothetical protein
MLMMAVKTLLAGHDAREGQRVRADHPLRVGHACVQADLHVFSATLITVLSRNVRNSSVHSAARASPCPLQGLASSPACR